MKKNKIILTSLLLSTITLGFNITSCKEKEIRVEKIEIGDRKTINVDDKLILEPTILPTNATNKNLLYFSSNETVATVSKNGEIIAHKPGISKITAVSVSSGDVIDELTLTVEGIDKDAYIEVEEINLPDEINIFLGQEINLEPTILPANATNKNVNFFVDNKEIIQVSETGELTALKEGKAIVSAVSSNNKVARTTVNISLTPVNIEEIEVNEKNYEIEVETQLSLEVSLLPTNTTETNYTFKFVEEVRGEDALVSKTQFIAFKAGTYKIQAISLDNENIKSDVITIIVKDTKNENKTLLNELKTKIDNNLNFENEKINFVNKNITEIDYKDGSISDTNTSYEVFKLSSDNEKLHSSGLITETSVEGKERIVNKTNFSWGYLDNSDDFYSLTINPENRNESYLQTFNDGTAQIYNEGITNTASKIISNFIDKSDSLDYEVSKKEIFGKTTYTLDGTGYIKGSFYAEIYSSFSINVTFDNENKLINFISSIKKGDTYTDSKAFIEEEITAISANYDINRKVEEDPIVSVNDFIIKDADVYLKSTDRIINDEVFISNGNESEFQYELDIENISPISATVEEFDKFVIDFENLPDGVKKHDYNDSIYFTKADTYNIPIKTLKNSLSSPKTIKVIAKIPQLLEISIEGNGFAYFGDTKIKENKTITDIVVEAKPNLAINDYSIALKTKDNQDNYIPLTDEIAKLEEVTNEDKKTYTFTALKEGTVYIYAVSLSNPQINSVRKIIIEKDYTEEYFDDKFLKGDYIYEASIHNSDNNYEVSLKNKAVATFNKEDKTLTILGDGDENASDQFGCSLKNLKLVFNYSYELNWNYELEPKFKFNYQASDCANSKVKFSNYGMNAYLSVDKNNIKFNKLSITGLKSGDGASYSIDLFYTLKEIK